MFDLTKQLRLARLVASFGIAIHGFWIPAIPAGMTLFQNDERGRINESIFDN
ncbi:MAG: hypothetical protein Q8L15_14475 [Methylobacter sp.]|nr:hypothetical protein [Methylobacter sp.]